MLAVSLEKRIRALELRKGKRALLSLHEVETVPPVGDLADDMQTTQANDFEVHVVPLRLHGRIQVFRGSAVIRSNVTDGTVVEAGLAVYKYNPSAYDPDNPVSSSTPYTLRRVAVLGSQTHTETADSGTQVPARVNVDLVREVTLDPRAGLFFVAYTANVYAKWLCPGHGMGDPARRKGRKTNYIGTNALDFPELLTVTGSTAAVPWVALRSTLGVRIYGDVANYD